MPDDTPVEATCHFSLHYASEAHLKRPQCSKTEPRRSLQLHARAAERQLQPPDLLRLAALRARPESARLLHPVRLLRAREHPRRRAHDGHVVVRHADHDGDLRRRQRRYAIRSFPFSKRRFRRFGANERPSPPPLLHSPTVFLWSAVLALETRFWTFLNHFSVWASILVWFLFVIIYTVMAVSCPEQAPPRTLAHATGIPRLASIESHSASRRQSEWPRQPSPVPFGDVAWRGVAAWRDGQARLVGQHVRRLLHAGVGRDLLVDGDRDGAAHPTIPRAQQRPRARRARVVARGARLVGALRRVRRY